MRQVQVREVKRTCACGKTGEGKAGSVADNTPPGWGTLMDHAGWIGFACGDCAAKIREHAQAIVKLAGRGGLYFDALVRCGLPRENPK